MARILYLDIVNDIKSKIEKGVLRPGDMLPSENEMTELYGVSRTTLRKGLALLVNEDYIYTIQVKWHFVCEPANSHYQFYFDEIDSLKVEIEEVKLHSVRSVPPSRKLIRELGVRPYEYVVKIEKVAMEDDKIIMVSIVNIPYEKGNPIVESVINFANYDGYIKEDDLQFQIRKKLRLEIVVPPMEICELLDIPPGDCCFRISQRIVSLKDNSPVSYNEYYINRNYYELEAETTI